MPFTIKQSFYPVVTIWSTICPTMAFAGKYARRTRGAVMHISKSDAATTLPSKQLNMLRVTMLAAN